MSLSAKPDGTQFGHNGPSEPAAPTSCSRKAKTPRPYLLHKPRGLISQRVQAVGPEHFGVVCVDCAKGSSKYFLADFYGHMRIEPTVVHHTRGDLQAALDRLREARTQHEFR